MKTHLVLALTTATTLAQGPLLPPAAPAPSMKTLAQIEARTAIPASPIIPIAGPHFTITAPGSYYLTGNITVDTGDGILITAASDVSIDLNGFTIRSLLTGSFIGSAVRCPSNFARLTVKNGCLVSGSIPPGTLQGFSHGIVCNGFLSEANISGVHVRGMANTGIYLDFFGSVENCTATANGYYGIFAPGGIVSHCRATNNAHHGILVDIGIASHCVASNNSTVPLAFNKQIKVSADGQRDACVPASE